VAHQIVGQGPFLGDIAHEHRDRAADRLVDVDDENLVVVSEEYRAAAAGRQHRPDLHLDDRLVHPRKPYQPDNELQILLLMIVILIMLLSEGEDCSKDQEQDQDQEQEGGPHFTFRNAGLHVDRAD